MLRNLYTTVALALIPSTQQVLGKFETLVSHLDAQTVHVERLLEDKAVALAHNALHRRTAMDRVHAFTEAAHNLAYKLLDTIEASFQRREKRIITDVTSLRSRLDTASEIRDRVSALLNR